MLKNYLKIAWRNLKRNRSFSFINISGLAIGMAAAIIIGVWVQNELSYDRFYANQNTLYKVFNRTTGPGDIGTWDVTSGPVGRTLKNDFPDVRNTSRIYWSSERLFSYGDKSVKATGNDVDRSFLSMFDFPLIKGNRNRVLNDVSSIVLTESLAKDLFGNEDAMNKIIKVDNKNNYKVTGVLKDLPNNTEFNFSYLVSLEANENYYGNDWGTYTYYTYVQLQPGVSAEKFNEKIKGTITKYAPQLGIRVFLYPVSKSHLYSRFENGKPAGGRIEAVHLLVIIALLILFIACINFMNLSTAQSQKRAKEVGVRKVTGAGKISLIGQFLCESVVIAFIAGAFALIIVQWSLPFVNRIIDKSLTLHFENPLLWLSLVAFIVFAGLLAGSYPAFFLSRFKPVVVLKAGKENKNPFSLRKILVVTQFSAATILIACTFVVYRQIKYVQNRDAGYNIGHLIDVPIEGSIRKNYDIIKTDLLNSGAVTAMCKNSLGVTVDGRTQAGYVWEGSTQDQQNNLLFSRTGTDGDFVKTMGLRLLGGRDIDFAEYPADSASALLNETAVKKMGIKNPVGNYIKEGAQTYTISGVFKDFIIGSPYDIVKPMIVVGTRHWVYHIIMRLNEKNDLSKELGLAEKIFKKYNPAYPFTYHFVDEQYEQNFSEQKQTGALAALFAGLTIFISCLGLFGLAAYVAESRAKEIGVRKVLGASVSGIVGMLSKNFAKLVLVASVIAFPIAWWAMNKWLQSFAYRIDIGWWAFVAAAGIALVIAFVTVSFHAIRAAIANPVKSLRTE